MNLLAYSSFALALLAMVFGVSALLSLRKQYKVQAEIEKNIKQILQSLSILRDSEKGLGDKLVSFEKKLNLALKADTSGHDAEENAFAIAAHMLREGRNYEDIMESITITESELRLIQMIEEASIELKAESNQSS